MKINKISLFVYLTIFLNLNVIAQSVTSYVVGNEFIPAGYMGCTDKIDINPAYSIEPHSIPVCFKIEFLTSCSKGFAGVYWTNTADDTGANWGQYPGIDLSRRRFTRLSFWAKGQNGGEIIEFGSGGINNTLNDPNKFRYKDNYNKKYPEEGKNVVLTNGWHQYSISLVGEDLSSVIGGFYWSVNWRANPTGVTFYLDDIKFE
jgi:hypothetical protein